MSSTRHPVKRDKFLRLLAELGFALVPGRGRGSHRVYVNEAGTVLTVPMSERDLPPVVVMAVARQIESSGLMPKAEFLARLQ